MTTAREIASLSRVMPPVPELRFVERAWRKAVEPSVTRQAVRAREVRAGAQKKQQAQAIAPPTDQQVRDALRKHGGNIVKAARELGYRHPESLRNRVKRMRSGQ